MRRFAWFLIALLLVACDDPSADSDAGVLRDASGGSADASTRDANIDDAGTSDAGPSDAGSSDAGPSDAGPDDAGVGDAGAGLRQATVSLTQNRTFAPPTHVVYGGFYPELVAPPIAEEGVIPCAASATAGACGLYRCTSLGDRATAGTLIATVEGTEIARLIEPGPSGDYGHSAPSLVAQPGDVVSFQATGGEVPAFSGMVTVPGAIAATLPAAVSRDVPLTLTWSVSSAERIQVVVAASAAAIGCIVDATDESVVVAPELLGMLPAGPGAVSVTAFNFVGLTAGDYRVLLTAADATSSVVTLE